MHIDFSIHGPLLHQYLSQAGLVFVTIWCGSIEFETMCTIDEIHTVYVVVVIIFGVDYVIIYRCRSAVLLKW